MKHVNLFSTMDLYNSAKLQYPNISYVEETEKVIVSNKLFPKNNQIFYTSTDGNIVKPRNVGTIVSNTYEDGQGVITTRNDITEIGEWAFRNTNLSSIVLPSSVSNFGKWAFNNTKLISIVIPSSVSNFADEVFISNSELTSVIFEKGSQITSITTSTFSSCGSLISIDIPSGVTNIGKNAFLACIKLTSISIPSSVTIIGDSAFWYCEKLNSIKYDGTSVQFTSITKENSWKYRVPASCIVHCTDGDFPITQFA